MDFLNEIKNEYENVTGELMIPFEEWSDKVKDLFEFCKVNNYKADYFVNCLLRKF